MSDTEHNHYVTSLDGGNTWAITASPFCSYLNIYCTLFLYDGTKFMYYVKVILSPFNDDVTWKTSGMTGICYCIVELIYLILMVIIPHLKLKYHSNYIKI